MKQIKNKRSMGSSKELEELGNRVSSTISSRKSKRNWCRRSTWSQSNCCAAVLTRRRPKMLWSTWIDKLDRSENKLKKICLGKAGMRTADSKYILQEGCSSLIMKCLNLRRGQSSLLGRHRGRWGKEGSSMSLWKWSNRTPHIYKTWDRLKAPWRVRKGCREWSNRIRSFTSNRNKSSGLRTNTALTPRTNETSILFLLKNYYLK